MRTNYAWARRAAIAAFCSAAVSTWAAEPTTAPAAVFDGKVELVRGGTLRLLGIGTSPTAKTAWWSIEGKSIAKPPRADEDIEAYDFEPFQGLAQVQGVTIGPPERFRQILWRRDVLDREVNDRPSVSVVKPLAYMGGEFTSELDQNVQPIGSVWRSFGRSLFQPRPEQSQQTFAVEGKQEDHRWQTFAIFTPGGPTRAGPIAFAIDKDDAGMARVKMDYDFDWPVRLVAVVKPGLRVEEPGSGTGFHHGDRHSLSQTFGIIPLDELESVHVQLCGVQTFEVRDLPLNPGPTSRPATIVNVHRPPSVPGLAPMDVALPPELPARWHFALIEYSQKQARDRRASTRPTTSRAE